MARNTILAYGSDLRQFLEWFGKHGPGPLNAVDLKVLTKYLEHLHGRGLSSTTVARHLVAILPAALPGTRRPGCCPLG